MRPSPGLLVGLAAGLSLGFLLGAASVQAEPGSRPYAGLDVLAQAFSHVADHYVEPLPQEELAHRALMGLAGSLDPFSAFYPPRLARQVQAEHAGQYVGPGMETEGAACGIAVKAVLPDGPAARAGVQAADCIVEIGDVAVAALGTELATGRLNGTEGSVLTVTVERSGATRRLVMALVRIEPRWIEVESLGKGWWYIGLREIREGAARRVRETVTAPTKGIVLDLRGNRGGVLEEAVALADLFLTDGEVVSSRGRGPGQEHRYSATADNELSGELRVLIDAGSASAAEVLAGALQERRRARLYGEPSFGKGLVQTFYHYDDGSVLKLTTGRYLLPSGRSLDARHPLQPDVPVSAAPRPPLPSMTPPALGWALPDLPETSLREPSPGSSLPVRQRAPDDPVLQQALDGI